MDTNKPDKNSPEPGDAYQDFLHAVDKQLFGSRASPADLYGFAKSTLDKRDFETVGRQLGFDPKEVEGYCTNAVKFFCSFGSLFHLSTGHLKIVIRGAPCLACLVKCFHLLSHALPRKTRETIFEPAFNDDLADLLRNRRIYRSRVARAWLDFWFFTHELFQIANCCWVSLGSKLRKVLEIVLPDLWKRLF